MLPHEFFARHRGSEPQDSKRLLTPDQTAEYYGMPLGSIARHGSGLRAFQVAGEQTRRMKHRRQRWVVFHGDSLRAEGQAGFLHAPRHGDATALERLPVIVEHVKLARLDGQRLERSIERLAYHGCLVK